ncbi:IS3 family transposase [Dermabacter hominis]
MAKIRLIHHNDPEFGYRLIADELHAQGVKISERRVWRLYSSAEIFFGDLQAQTT